MLTRWITGMAHYSVARFVVQLLLAALPWATAAHAADTGYLERPDGKAFVEQLVRDHAFDAEQLQYWLAQAVRKDSILEAISRPAEKRLAWKDYRKIFVTDDRIEQGKAFLETYADSFARAEKESGVSRYIIAAIIGVETRFGKNKGSYRVIDALATLAFDYPPRSEFFRDELRQFFLLAREQGLDPLAMTGSYAGAMGYGQFISSSYRQWAQDYDGDQKIDLVNSPQDAIGSVANYFVAHGWSAGGAVADEASVKDAIAEPFLTEDQLPVHKVADYRVAGVALPDETPGSITADQPARLIRLEADAGTEYWLTYQNFYVITRYNHSDLYAMAVYQLSRLLEH